MSKYIKLEDAIGYECPLNEIWEDCINCPLNNSAVEPCKMGKWLNSLPTIEVSEDCISRATVLEIYSDLYWIDERLLHFKDELDEVYKKFRTAPSVVPIEGIEE